jgi:Ca2+-binding EF-hand superfamily protein
MRIPLALLGAGLLCVNGVWAQTPKPYDPRASFAETDTNKDGQIDIEEFHVRLVEVFYNADTNKDGFLSIDEYERLPFSGAFKDADTNGDGRLSLPEFVAIRFRQFEEADTNHDYQLSVEEVVTAYEGRKQQ